MKFNKSIVFGFQGNREMKTYSLPSEKTIDLSVSEKYKPELAANPGSEVTFYRLGRCFRSIVVLETLGNCAIELKNENIALTFQCYCVSGQVNQYVENKMISVWSIAYFMVIY